MTTQTTNSMSDLGTTAPARPAWAPVWAGRGSFVLALFGLVMICVNDPAWLALPGSFAAMLLGWYALRRGAARQAAAHLGLNLGLMNLMLWIVVILIVRHLLGVDLWLFDVTDVTS